VGNNFAIPTIYHLLFTIYHASLWLNGLSNQDIPRPNSVLGT
jgi:hypothetical protein